MSAAVCKKAVPHDHRQSGSCSTGLEKLVLFANLLFAHIYRRPHKADSHAAASLSPAATCAPSHTGRRLLQRKFLLGPRAVGAEGQQLTLCCPVHPELTSHVLAGIGHWARSSSPKVLPSDLHPPHALALSPATTLTPPSHRQAQKQLPAAEDLLSPPRQNRSRRVSNRFFRRVRRGMPARSRL